MYRIKSLSLASRLFLSHLVVMVVGVASLVVMSRIFSPQFFVLHLQHLESRGMRLVGIRGELVQGFELAWRRSTFWSVLVGAITAGGLSWWVCQRILQRLSEMEKITQEFAAGKFDTRLPASEIPEFRQLSYSFNRMADSIQNIESRRRDLISDMSHELRTPLTVMRGYLEELADGNQEPNPQIYTQLIRETKRLERLVNDLQELSKAEAGYLPIQPKPINLHPLLVSLVIKFREQLLEDGPTLELQSPGNLPVVMADVDRVEQILINLIGNAIRYTPTGKIIVSTHRDKNYLWITIEDTGIGIAADDLPHVFERFWRADKSRDRNFGGTGIGLAITKCLVELQGGKIEVESQLHVGSKFRFCLPLA